MSSYRVHELHAETGLRITLPAALATNFIANSFYTLFPMKRSLRRGERTSVRPLSWTENPPPPLLLAFPRKFKLQQGTTIRRNSRSETLLEIEGCTRPFPDSFQRALNPLPRGNGRALPVSPRRRRRWGRDADTVSVANDDADRWILRQWHHQNEERLGGVHLTLLMILRAP